MALYKTFKHIELDVQQNFSSWSIMTVSDLTSDCQYSPISKPDIPCKMIYVQC